MIGKLEIKKLASGGRRVQWNSNDSFDISPEMMNMINKVGGRDVDNSSPSDAKDQVVLETLRAMEDTARNRLELGFYGRAILEMHPSSLTHVTCAIPREGVKPYLSVCMYIGKQLRKLAGTR